MQSVPVASAPTRADRAARGVFFVLLFLAIFTYPQKPTAELDPSWRMALTQALVDGWQFGRDLVFTYGPLGFLMGNTYSGVAFWPFVVWQAVSALLFATLIYRQGMRLTGYARGFYWGTTILLGVGYMDALLMVVIGLIGFEMVREAGRQNRWWVAAGLGLYGFLAVIKFTNLMLCGFITLVAAALDLWQRRRGDAAWKVLWFFGSFLFLWTLCGQSVLNLPAYLRHSLEISSGYEQTMGLVGSGTALAMGVAVFLALVAYAGLHLLGHADRPRALAGGLVLGAYLYLNWKHGFVRADGHMIGFFICALVPITAFPALLDEPPRFRRLQRALLVPAGVLCVLGIHEALPGTVRFALGNFQERVYANLYNTLHFDRFYASYRDKLRTERHDHDLAKTRAVVGSGTLDVLGYHQAVALYNRFNYRPRPVLQSYSAYTPQLQQLNADYYASDRAPDFVLFRLETIDDRYMMLDDARALYVFLHRYEFVHSEKGFQLWRRRAKPFDAAAIAPQPLAATELAVGQPLDLSAHGTQPLWIEIDLPRTLLGRLRDFFYKPPIVRLALKDTKGNTTTYRLPLPLARAGFLINPMIEEIVGFMHFTGGTPERHAASATIIVDAADRKYLAPTARVKLAAARASQNGADYFLEAEKLRFHMFKTVPMAYEAQTPVSAGEIDGTPVMVLHARSEMTFNLREGAQRIRGAFGFLPGTYTDGGNTDGAEFIVFWSNGAERVELFKRFLDPVKQPKDRGLHRFDVPLPPQPGGRVFLRINPGPLGNYSWDWTAWTDIEIK